MSLSSENSLLSNRLISATDGPDCRSAISSFCSSFAEMDDETHLADGNALISSYSFMQNAMSILTRCKLVNNTEVIEGR